MTQTPFTQRIRRAAAPPASDPDPVLPIDLESYVQLLTATGVALRAAPSESRIDEPSAQLLERLGIRSERWVETVKEYRRHFFSMVGTVEQIALYCARIDRDRAKGSRWARKVFRIAA